MIDPMLWYVVERSTGVSWIQEGPRHETYDQAQKFYNEEVLDVSKELDSFRICVIVKEEVKYIPRKQ